MNTLLQVPDAPRPFESTNSDRWTRRRAAHLLRRAGFGANFAEIEEAHASGLNATLDRLLSAKPESGQFRSTQELLRNTAIDTGNIADLKAWWLYRMASSRNPLVEKMSLFWHNHFATSYAKVRSVNHMLAQNNLIRQHSVGSFRKLLHGMSRDVAMLVWLDGNANRKRHANENFAREVMELFTLGVGNYTEKDIAEAARAFTGWHVRDEKFWFNSGQHDFSTKNVLGKIGNFDGAQVIDICLDQLACPQFLAGKLLQTFVVPHPSREQIEGFAERIRAHDYQMSPVLRELFGSRLFFSPQARQSIIKSPLDLVLGAHRALGSQVNLQNTARILAELGQDVFEPPTVKGWEGNRLWISSATLLQRTNFAAELTRGERLGRIADPGKMVEKYNCKDDKQIVQHYRDLLLADDLEPAAFASLESHLSQTTGTRSTRIRGLIHLMLSMPQYQLL